MTLALVPPLEGGPQPVSANHRPSTEVTLAEAVRALQDNKIRPWMKAYAAWLAIQPRFPASPVRLNQARKASRLPLTKKLLRQVEQSEPFLAVYQRYAEDDMERARAVVERHAERTVKAHFQGLKMALKAKDHRAITNYTVPILDRVSPKRQEQGQTTNIVTIHLGKPESFAAKSFNSGEITDVEVELVPET